MIPYICDTRSIYKLTSSWYYIHGWSDEVAGSAHTSHRIRLAEALVRNNLGDLWGFSCVHEPSWSKLFRDVYIESTPILHLAGPLPLGVIPCSLVDTIPCHFNPFTMATVSTKNTPISYRPTTIPQTTSSTYLSTQQQNTTAPRTVDGKVGQFLAKARLPMGKGEAQTFVEELEKVSRSHLSPTDPCIEPMGDRCWTLTIRSLCTQGGDVFEGSWSFAGNTASSLLRISFLNLRSKGGRRTHTLWVVLRNLARDVRRREMRRD